MLRSPPRYCNALKYGTLETGPGRWKLFYIRGRNLGGIQKGFLGGYLSTDLPLLPNNKIAFSSKELVREPSGQGVWVPERKTHLSCWQRHALPAHCETDGDTVSRYEEVLASKTVAPEGKGQLLTLSPQHQTWDLPVLGCYCPSCPPPSACHTQGCHRKQCAPARPWLRRRRPGVRHHNDSHFLGNRESHLYLCWEPPHLELSCDSGSYF